MLTMDAIAKSSSLLSAGCFVDEMGISAIALPTNIATLTSTIVASTSPKFQAQSCKSFNSNLDSYSKSGKLDEALQLIKSQNTKNIQIEPCTTFLHACISGKSLKHGQQLYNHLPGYLIKNPAIKSKFITLFSVCGQIDEARRIFQEGLEVEDVHESVWVAMIIGYSRNGDWKDALLLYSVMLFRRVEQGNFVFSVVLKACAELLELRTGKAVHAQVIKARIGADQVVYNSLLRFYCECGSSREVLKVFDKMPLRNVATWNSIMAGLVKKNEVFKAFSTFRRMLRDGVGFSWVSLTTILVACGQLTSVYNGKEIHGQILKSDQIPDVILLNSLMDMYAKCGEVDYCGRIFNAMNFKDLTSWNIMVNAYATNGNIEDANKLFDKMTASGIRPDEVTFISLLSGCSHVGEVSRGKRTFQRMIVEFGMEPNVEHLACLVDILSRAGKFEEALEVINAMSTKPGGSIWGSLLNACRLHNNVPLAEIIAKKLFEIEPENPGNYIILSNIYANAGKWDAMNMIRDTMTKKCMKKEVGCSWIQIKNRFITFVANGGLEFRNSKEYKKVEENLMKAITKNGYKPDTRVVLHDIDDELKSDWVCGHSEKLATMFGLIHTSSGGPIRVTKNLRVCLDCHSWMKFVSEVTSRRIILRDTTRFHHFENGLCSCNDYW